ncbi:hypothetical protein N9D63_06385 [Opitutales bacterium]|nr:hypothetical protein [Opitutales bacterium]
MNAGLPWMTYNAIFFLNNILKGNEIVFETGCGGSTIFYLERVKSLLSIEHESSWSEKLKRDRRISKYSKKWECAHRNLNLDKYNNTDDSPYLQRIRELPDNSFSLGSIDGRLRSKSLIISADKIMRGGYLLLDNSDRVEYKEGIHYLKEHEWRKTDLSGLCYDYDWESSTTVWQKI